jgi:hypothetical protein
MRYYPYANGRKKSDKSAPGYGRWWIRSLSRCSADGKVAPHVQTKTVPAGFFLTYRDEPLLTLHAASSRVTASTRGGARWLDMADRRHTDARTTRHKLLPRADLTGHSPRACELRMFAAKNSRRRRPRRAPGECVRCQSGQAMRVVEAVFAGIKGALKDGDEVRIGGFGIFRCTQRKGGIRRNRAPVRKSTSAPSAW